MLWSSQPQTETAPRIMTDTTQAQKPNRMLRLPYSLKTTSVRVWISARFIGMRG